MHLRNRIVFYFPNSALRVLLLDIFFIASPDKLLPTDRMEIIDSLFAVCDSMCIIPFERYFLVAH
jgi:hypothetical protein